MPFEQWLAGRIPGVDYARVSADPSARSATRRRLREAGTGVRHQHEDNLETAARLGIAIVASFEDNSMSAVNPHVVRQAFREIIAALLFRQTQDGLPVRAVIATERERVWRTESDGLAFQQAVTVMSDGLFVERGKPYEWPGPQQAVPGALSGEQEVENTRRRIGRSVRRRAIDGSSPGGRRRFGWQAADPTLGVQVNMLMDTAEWPILCKMIEAGLQGIPWKEIARRLNADGVLTASGKAWSGETVRQALVNPVLCGYRAIHGELVLDPTTGRPVVGKWDKPASVPEWQRLVEISRARGATRGTRLSNGSPKPGGTVGRPRKYLFSGTLRCGAATASADPCLQRMGGVRRPTSADPDNAVYTCTRLGCGRTARNMRSVDEYLTRMVLSVMDERRRSSPMHAVARPGAEVLRRLYEELRLLDDRLLAESGTDSALVLHRHGLLERIALLEATQTARTNGEPEQACIPSAWPDMSLAERRAAIETVLECVVVHPLPPGRSRCAPFDPGLLEIRYREWVRPVAAGSAGLAARNDSRS
ncbi:hypothetical protein G5C51_35365 [Streptomyces sp. A7024]|uniref:Recombinase domain-containing protein n=1 Tax=Streptomyces coryli TaxID=1128680 RepID=A0A6G4UA86_9ACTN|nr:recombinase family protein [Streptomyces coryli]NGN69155.1 hypothetical protein [Streptomyces coryli]